MIFIQLELYCLSPPRELGEDLMSRPWWGQISWFFCTMGKINSTLLLLYNRGDFVVMQAICSAKMPTYTTQHNATERGWITDRAELETSTLPGPPGALRSF